MTDLYSHQGDDHPWHVGKIHGWVDWNSFRVVWVCPCGVSKSVKYKAVEDGPPLPAPRPQGHQGR